jgi:hypothetical protein
MAPIAKQTSLPLPDEFPRKRKRSDNPAGTPQNPF